jgi:hypothetical protein
MANDCAASDRQNPSGGPAIHTLIAGLGSL